MTPHDWIHVIFGCAIIVLFMRSSASNDLIATVIEATSEGVTSLVDAINNIHSDLKDHKRHGGKM
jgi:hypothetical protein